VIFNNKINKQDSIQSMWKVKIFQSLKLKKRGTGEQMGKTRRYHLVQSKTFTSEEESGKHLYLSSSISHNLFFLTFSVAFPFFFFSDFLVNRLPHKHLKQSHKHIRHYKTPKRKHRRSTYFLNEFLPTQRRRRRKIERICSSLKL